MRRFGSMAASLIVGWAGARQGAVAEAPAGPPRAQEQAQETPRNYSKRVEFHDVSTIVHPPSAEDQRPAPSAQASRPAFEGPAQTAAPPVVPNEPPLRRRDAAGQKDARWDSSEDDEEAEPSGWGWLWDEIAKDKAREKNGREASRRQSTGQREEGASEDDPGEEEARAVGEDMAKSYGLPSLDRDNQRAQPSAEARSALRADSSSIPLLNAPVISGYADSADRAGWAASTPGQAAAGSAEKEEDAFPRIHGTVGAIVDSVGLRIRGLSEVSAGLKPVDLGAAAGQRQAAEGDAVRALGPPRAEMAGPLDGPASARSPLAMPGPSWGGAPGGGSPLVKPAGVGAQPDSLIVSPSRAPDALGSSFDAQKSGSRKTLPW
jgi:hypothetical protein